MEGARPIVAYALASAGMGHATRAVPIVSHLLERYDVHLFAGGPAKAFLEKKFPNVHSIHRFKSISVGGKSSLPLMLAYVVVAAPLTLASILKFAWFVLRKKPKAVITDFEGHSVYGALLARPFVKSKIIACDHWIGVRFAEPPFELTKGERARLEYWQTLVGRVNPFADVFLVHGAVRTRLKHSRARYVPPPIRDEFVARDGESSSDGPIAVSIGSRSFPDLPERLEATGRRFVVFGYPGGTSTDRVEFRPFDEGSYIAALRRAPFAIVSANSSALDVLAAKKPLVMVPSPRQFEQWYCANMFQSIGVGRHVPELTKEALDDFVRDLDKYAEAARTAKIFDNATLFREIDRELDE